MPTKLRMIFAFNTLNMDGLRRLCYVYFIPPISSLIEITTITYGPGYNHVGGHFQGMNAVSRFAGHGFYVPVRVSTLRIVVDMISRSKTRDPVETRAVQRKTNK